MMIGADTRSRDTQQRRTPAEAADRNGIPCVPRVRRSNRVVWDGPTAHDSSGLPSGLPCGWSPVVVSCASCQLTVTCVVHLANIDVLRQSSPEPPSCVCVLVHCDHTLYAGWEDVAEFLDAIHDVPAEVRLLLLYLLHSVRVILPCPPPLSPRPLVLLVLSLSSSSRPHRPPPARLRPPPGCDHRVTTPC